jgi:hypothetical protein
MANATEGTAESRGRWAALVRWIDARLPVTEFW